MFHLLKHFFSSAGNLQCRGPEGSNSLNYPDQPLLGSLPTLLTAQELHLSSAWGYGFLPEQCCRSACLHCSRPQHVYGLFLSLWACLATVGLCLALATLAGHDPDLTSWLGIRPVLLPWACLVIWTCSHLWGCPTALLGRSDGSCWPGDPHPLSSSQLLLCLDW